jgi:hypothetical protein
MLMRNISYFCTYWDSLMDENRLNILNASNRMLSKLQLLSAFFAEDVLYKIYLRSQVIHKLFDNNPEIDINKLDLFHLQFTTSVVELMQKIKKNNENNIRILFDEVQLNEDMIEKLNETIYTQQNYDLDKQRQSLKINLSLRKLFQVLSDETKENPLSKNINAFSARFAPDFFYSIDLSLYDDLIKYKPSEVYSNNYAIIQKKLMGALCKYDFKTEFFCGLKSAGNIAEVYKFINVDKYFLYFPAHELFIFCDILKISGIDWSNNLSKKEKLINELNDKNDKLKSSAGAIRSMMPAEIKTLLAEVYIKIESMDFLENLSNIDVQANILKTMLNTDLN